MLEEVESREADQQSVELGWEEADAIEEERIEWSRRVQSLQDRWQGRVTARRDAEERHRALNNEVHGLHGRLAELTNVDQAIQGGKVLLAGFEQLWKSPELSHTALSQHTLAVLATLPARSNASSDTPVEEDAFFAKVEAMQAVFKCALSALSRDEDVGARGVMAEQALQRRLDASKQLSKAFSDQLISYTGRVVRRSLTVALEALCHVCQPISGPPDANLSPDHPVWRAVHEQCSVYASRAGELRRQAMTAVSVAWLCARLTALQNGVNQLAWFHGGIAKISDLRGTASVGDRDEILRRLNEASTRTTAALNALEDTRRRHAETREELVATLSLVAEQHPHGQQVVDASALEQAMHRRVALESVQKLCVEEDARVSTTQERVKQLVMLAEVVLRLEGLRDATGDGSGALIEETSSMLRKLLTACQHETQLTTLVQEQTLVLSGLQSASDADDQMASQSKALDRAEQALQQARGACTTQLEVTSGVASELERLENEASIMEREVTALQDELERLGRSAEDLAKHAPEELGRLGGAGVVPILNAANTLRDAWQHMHECTTTLTLTFLPRALQLGSRPSQLWKLLYDANTGGSPSDETQQRNAIDAFLTSTQEAASAVYPQLKHLGEVLASAAEGGTASSAGANEATGEATEAAIASKTTATATPGTGSSPLGANVKGPKQERNVHALTVLRRIKCKLDGKDRWPGRERETRQSVSEQVESVIKQACSPENLSMMYEGWCAWV